MCFRTSMQGCVCVLAKAYVFVFLCSLHAWACAVGHFGNTHANGDDLAKGLLLCCFVLLMCVAVHFEACSCPKHHVLDNADIAGQRHADDECRATQI